MSKKKKKKKKKKNHQKKKKMKRFIFSLVVLLVASLAIPSELAKDLKALQKDVSQLREARAGEKSTFLSVSSDGGDGGDDNAAAAGGVDPVAEDMRRYGSGALGLSLNSPTTTFYRAGVTSAAGPVPQALVIVRSPSQYGDSVSWYVRWWKGGDVTQGTECRPTTDSKGLRCKMNGLLHEFKSVSPSGITCVDLSLSTTTDLLFWRDDFAQPFKRVHVTSLVSSTSEFLQLYESAVSQRLAAGAEPSAVAWTSAYYQAGRLGISSAVQTYITNWASKKPLQNGGETPADYEKRLATDKLALESLANAVADNMKVLESWAAKISAIATDPANNPDPFPAAERSRFSQAVGDAVRTAPATLASGTGPRKVTLNPDSSKYLRQGSDAGGDLISKQLGKMLGDYQKSLSPQDIAADPSIDASKFIAEINNGNMKKLFSAQIYDGMAANPAIAEGLNSVTDFAAEAQKAAEQKGKEIGDYFKGFIGLGKKKAAVNKAVDAAVAANPGTPGQPSTLKPGEDQAAKNLFAAAATNDAAKAAAAQEKLKFKTSFNLQPDFKVALPAAGATPLQSLSNMLTAVNLKAKLEISKGKTNAAFEVKAKVSDPLNPEKARADIEVSLKGNTVLNNGGQLSAGITAKGTVLGLYKSPELQGIIIDTFITYKSKDGRLSTGLFTTINVPMSDAANGGTYFKQGAEIDMRANFAYTSRSGRDTFTAYANLKASQMGSMEYGVGGRYERKFLGGAFFAEVGVAGGNTDRYNGGFGRPEARASIGLVWRF
jgi:hypothetical protein